MSDANVMAEICPECGNTSFPEDEITRLRAEVGLADAQIEYQRGETAKLRLEVERLEVVAGCLERAENVTKWLKRHWANQDMNHEDFRVEAFRQAEAYDNPTKE